MINKELSFYVTSELAVAPSHAEYDLVLWNDPVWGRPRSWPPDHRWDIHDAEGGGRNIRYHVS